MSTAPWSAGRASIRGDSWRSSPAAGQRRSKRPDGPAWAGPGCIIEFSSKQVQPMYYVVAAIYVIVCFVLMLVILLQQGKGGDIASAFGGGSSQAAFGARSGATVLSRATTLCA